MKKGNVSRLCWFIFFIIFGIVVLVKHNERLHQLGIILNRENADSCVLASFVLFGLAIYSLRNFNK